ncbi:MAG: S8 family serine peptidase [Actinomycetota bacterium]|nr:S8 family serine peptidase [Actinomycetota bacterium]
MFLRSSSRLRRAAIAAALGAGLVVPLAGIAVAGPSSPATPSSVSDAAAGKRAYFVITEPSNVAAGKKAVTDNGGTVFNSFDAIGVIVAHSEIADFATKVRQVSGVQQVGATRTSDVPAAATNPAIPSAPSQVTPGAESIGWDIKQVKADLAWTKTEGEGAIVAVLDTGVDDAHADIKPNFDYEKSVSCAYGKVDARQGAWRDVAGVSHGTHVAGTIGAAKNNLGMVGVAPKAKIRAVRVAEAGNELFFPENTVCAFVYAADSGAHVTNNSYWTDPWWGLCATDADQKAIAEGVNRAVRYAKDKGLINLVAAGNESKDYASKGSISVSPNDSTPVNRDVSGCKLMPQEADGATVVSGIDQQGNRYSGSNFDTNGAVDVTAGGVNVNSTVKGGRYSQLTGTSMASPHAAGVAALIKAANPTFTGAQIEAKMKETAGGYTDAKYYGAGLPDAQKAVEGGAPQPGTSWQNDNDVQITDNNVAVTSSVTANGEAAPSATSTVNVDIVHSYIGDLAIDLVAPDGTVFALKPAVAHDATRNLVTAYTVNLSGETSTGEYKLRVRDAYKYDTGHINSWKLTIG